MQQDNTEDNTIKQNTIFTCILSPFWYFDFPLSAMFVLILKIETASVSELLEKLVNVSANPS